MRGIVKPSDLADKHLYYMSITENNDKGEAPFTMYGKMVKVNKDNWMNVCGGYLIFDIVALSQHINVNGYKWISRVDISNNEFVIDYGTDIYRVENMIFVGPKYAPSEFIVTDPEIALKMATKYSRNLKYIDKSLHTLELYAAMLENGVCPLPYIDYMPDSLSLESVKKDCHSIKYIKDKTPELKMLAVTQDGTTLQYIDEQTDDLCLAAVGCSGMALQYVKNKTEAICMAAIEKTGMALQFSPYKPDEYCIVAIKNSINALKFVPLNPSDDILKTAISVNSIVTLQYFPSAIRFIENPSYTSYVDAVCHNGNNLKYISEKNQDEYICEIALRKCKHRESREECASGIALKYVINPTPKLCVIATKTCKHALSLVKNQTEEMCIAVVSVYGKALNYVHNKTVAVCEAALKNDGLALKYIINQTEKMCEIAVKQNGMAIKYVRIKQTLRMCLFAVYRNAYSLAHMDDEILANNPVIREIAHVFLSK